MSRLSRGGGGTREPPEQRGNGEQAEQSREQAEQSGEQAEQSGKQAEQSGGAGSRSYHRESEEQR